MGKTVKKTHQDFLKEMENKHPNLIILNKYFNSKTRIKYKCKKCGLIWNATASKLCLGRGCPQCAGNKLKTHKEYISEVKKINPNIIVMSQYKSTSYNVSFKCKICGYEWVTKPGSILRGKGCFMCGKKNMGMRLAKDPQKFQDEIYEINPDIQLLEPYYRDKTKILCHCNICNEEWYAWPSGLKGGHGCPYCITSKGEKIVQRYLKQNNINFISQYKFNDLYGVGGRLLSYDFYLPEHNLLIEYQGKQHKQPIEYFGGQDTFKRQKEHDKRKREYAFQHNIELLEIWYYEDIIKKIEKTLNLITVTTAGH